MSLSAIQTIASDFANGFDEIRRQLLGNNARLVLLKETDRESKDEPEFEIVKAFSEGWYPKYSEFFGTTTFNIADIHQLTAQKIRESSHLIVVNSNLSSINNLLHELTTDTAIPTPDKPIWGIRAKSTGCLYELRT